MTAYGYIADLTSANGDYIARVDGGFLYSLPTNQKIGTERDGELYSTDDEFLGYLSDLNAGTPGVVSGAESVALARLKKLAKG